MRQHFAKVIHDLMSKDESVYFLTGDLGMYVLDKIKEDFPDRFINVGAAEQTMLDIAVGLSHANKRVITYTITPFYLRAFETIRTYIQHEGHPILLAGSGRDQDYAHDGFSHDASDTPLLVSSLGVCTMNPTDNHMLEKFINRWYQDKIPVLLTLKK